MPQATSGEGETALLEEGNLEEARRLLESSGRYRVLERLDKPTTFAPGIEPTPPLFTGLYLDVETTGIDSADQIIQLGCLEFEYDAAGRIHAVLDEIDEYEDPGRPIPPEITRLTGITDADVAGKRIDEDRVGSALQRANLVIAHNASFDRPFVERRLPDFENAYWACSISDVDWRSEGFASSKLEWLAYQHGFFFEGHRATIDCLAGVRLLALELPKSGQTAMAKLRSCAQKRTVRLWAVGSSFDSKEALRRRGYRWNAEGKVWWRDLTADDHEAELEWLSANAYGGRRRPLPYFGYDAKLRYSARVPLGYSPTTDVR